MRQLFLFCLALFSVGSPLKAIVIYGGGSVANTVAPTGGANGDPGWGNIGSVNGATGVYLGNYGGSFWALTASHVSGGDLALLGNTYTYVPGSSTVILNGDNSQTDLTLFRISSDPSIASPSITNLNLAATLPSPVSIVRMIGNGTQETGSALFWDVTVDPSGPGSADTWTLTGSPTGSSYAGYSLGSGGKRWGDAFLTFNSLSYTVNGRTQTGIVTEFDKTTGSSQAASGDSGGALFYKNGSTWELLGILSAVATFSNSANTPDNQPGGTAVDGNLTLSVSIPAYRGAILTAIPEPADVAAWCAAGVGLVAIWRRRGFSRSGSPADPGSDAARTYQ